MMEIKPFYALPGEQVDTAFRCDCRNWIVYHGKRDVGAVLTCWNSTCRRRWRVVSDDIGENAVESLAEFLERKK